MKERLTIGFRPDHVAALKGVASDKGMDVYTLIRAAVLEKYETEIAIYQATQES